MISAWSDYFLYALMFSVGISVGGNRSVFSRLGRYNLSILVIPLGTIIGSFLGGVLTSILLGRDLGVATAISSGLGWYSLTGVMLTDLAGAEAGAVAFLSNLMREMLCFIFIPLLAKHVSEATLIAPAGATSEDTTLPMLMKYCSEDMIIIAVINGVICSAAVPFLVQLCYDFL